MQDKLQSINTEEGKVKNQASPKLIFIVEDNLLFLKSLQLFLNDKFPETDIAIFPLGELCLHSLHLNPDFIILDYHLDTKYSKAANGLQMIKQIRAAKQNAKIILLSAQDNIDVAVAAAKYKGCSYVTKNGDAYEKVYSIIQKSVNRQTNVNSLSRKKQAQPGTGNEIVNGETCL